MAEREGFEPSIHFTVYTLSRRAPSAARPPLRYEVGIVTKSNDLLQHTKSKIVTSN